MATVGVKGLKTIFKKIKSTLVMVTV